VHLFEETKNINSHIIKQYRSGLGLADERLHTCKIHHSFNISITATMPPFSSDIRCSLNRPSQGNGSGAYLCVEHRCLKPSSARSHAQEMDHTVRKVIRAKNSTATDHALISSVLTSASCTSVSLTIVEIKNMVLSPILPKPRL
jgi:hypothetical protein